MCRTSIRIQALVLLTIGTAVPYRFVAADIPAERRISVRFENATLAEVVSEVQKLSGVPCSVQLVDRVFAGSGLQYSLAPGVRAIQVSVDAENQPLDRVLRDAVYDALRRAPRLELLIDGSDTFVIRQHKPIPPEPTPQP